MTTTAATIYDPSVNPSSNHGLNSAGTSNGLTAVTYASTSSTTNHKPTPLHHSVINGTHHSQHHGPTTMYPSNNDYTTPSMNNCNGYWPYPTQTFFPGSTRQYMMPQNSSVSDGCSSPPRPDLTYSNHGSYGPMQKMVANYSTSYDFYPTHNSKYCWHRSCLLLDCR